MPFYKIDYRSDGDRELSVSMLSVCLDYDVSVLVFLEINRFVLLVVKIQPNSEIGNILKLFK